MDEKIDFLAIGDLVVDDFIRLSEAHINGGVDSEKSELCMSFKDKVPFEFSKIVYAVGNSANAAVSASRLGLKSALISNVGNDEDGKRCIEALQKDGVATEYVKTNDGKKTNYHYVLWYQSDRTILIKHEDFEYSIPEVKKPKWLYLSSLGEAAFPLHEKIVEYLNANPDVNLSFQPGTFQIRVGYEKLLNIYKKSKVFFCNIEEAQTILKTGVSNKIDLMKGLRDLGPEIIVLTDGPRGSYMLHNNEAYHLGAYPDPKEPYERTGAGDAFASTFVSALALGKEPADALMWSSINPMSVVQYIGAQEGLLTKEKLEEHLKNAPTGYKVVKLG